MLKPLIYAEFMYHSSIYKVCRQSISSHNKAINFLYIELIEVITDTYWLSLCLNNNIYIYIYNAFALNKYEHMKLSYNPHDSYNIFLFFVLYLQAITVWCPNGKEMYCHSFPPQNIFDIKAVFFMLEYSTASIGWLSYNHIIRKNFKCIL